MNSAEQVRLLAGRYRLDEVIGHGGMGTVWRARDELLNRDVAVKEIVWPSRLSYAELQTARRRAVREAQMAARLNHPNVVGIYDIVEEDGRPWIVMELVPYRSLRDILRDDGPLEPALAARLGLGVLAALRAAHAAGVLHRDVKPANVLVGPEQRVVLTDFGIARAADSQSLTTSGVLVGSPSYISPERARGAQAGTPADLWGLGASLYAAVEGRPPFERDGVLATLTAVTTDDPEPAPHAGPLWPVISGLLRKDPGERLDAADTERMLHHVLVQAPPAADAADAPRPRREPRREPRALIAALAGAAIVIAAAATSFALRAGGSPQHPTASPPVTSHPGTRSSPVTGTSGASSSASRPTSSASGPAASRSGPAASPSGSPAAYPGAGYGALPAGFYRYRDFTGFSIGVPQGWQISHTGHYVYIRDPENGGIFLLIDQSDQPKPDPLADWQQQQANRAGSYPGYHLIRLESIRYPQAEKAADWEFTYDRNGVLVHILNRNILANPQHAYALYWSTPESDWNAYYRYFQDFAATFTPAP
jgi:serine/threonine protein kinase